MQLLALQLVYNKNYFLNKIKSLGSYYYVRVLSILDKELLKTGSSVALHKYSNAIVEILPPEADSTIQLLRPDQKPDVSYFDIGGLDMQKQEIREAVELPLVHGELYKQVGFIDYRIFKFFKS